VRQRLLCVTVFVLVASAGVATAQSPEWRYGGRVSWVSAGVTSGELGDTGSTLDLESGPGAEFDATLMFSDLFGVELSVGFSFHRLEMRGSDLGDIDVGNVWFVPFTAIAQYHPPVYGPWDPYVGLGIDWTAPVFRMSGNASNAGIERIDLEGGPAIAAQIGVNYQMDNRWYANVDLRYLATSLDAQVTTDGEDFPTVTLNAEPLVVSFGFGHKF
jgi:outer membrane protein